MTGGETLTPGGDQVLEIDAGQWLISTFMSAPKLIAVRTPRPTVEMPATRKLPDSIGVGTDQVAESESSEEVLTQIPDLSIESQESAHLF